MIEAQIAALGSARNRSKKRLQMALWAPCGRPSAGSTQKTYKMVGNILDTHLLATLTRAVYAKSPSQWMKSVITRYFFRTLYPGTRVRKITPGITKLVPNLCTPYYTTRPVLRVCRRTAVD